MKYLQRFFKISFAIIFILTAKIEVRADQLDMGTSARELALAGTPLRIAGTLSAAGYNPSSLAEINGHQIFYNLEFFESSVNNFLIYGFSLGELGAGGIHYFSAKGSDFGITYAKTLNPNFSGGLTLRFLKDSDSWNVGFDAAMLYYLDHMGSKKPYNFATVSVNNIGKGWLHYNDANGPSPVCKLGISHALLDNVLLSSLAFDISNNSALRLAFEGIMADVISIRTGTVYQFSGYNALTLGIGLNFEEDKWSYGIALGSNGQTTHQFSLSINFATAVEQNKNSDEKSRSEVIAQCFTLAMQYYQSGNIKNAINEWEKITAMEPSNGLAGRYLRSAKEELELKINNNLKNAEGRYKEEKWEEALNIWEHILGMDPENQEARSKMNLIKNQLRELYGNGMIFYNDGNYVKAIGEWQQLLRLAPNYPQINELIGKAKAKMNEQKKGKELLQQYFEESRKYLDSGNLPLALDSLRKILNIDPNNETVKKYIDTLIKSSDTEGDAYFQQNKFLEAVKSWEKCLAIDPSRLDISQKIIKSKDLFEEKIDKFYKKGIDEYNKGNYFTAIESWQRALTVDSTNEKMKEYTIKATLAQGILYYRQDKLDDAIKTWEYALKLEPANQKASVYLKRARAKLQMLRELEKK